MDVLNVRLCTQQIAEMTAHEPVRDMSSDTANVC
jgi:hypothetical protein